MTDAVNPENTEQPIPCAYCFQPIEGEPIGAFLKLDDGSLLDAGRFCSEDHAEKFREFKAFQARNR